MLKLACDLLILLLVVQCVLLVHELGHLFAARALGLRVAACVVGFGPALLSLTDRRGTKWRWGLLPAGGKVELHDHAPPTNEPESPVPDAEQPGATDPKMALVYAAGPAANLLLAALAYALLSLCAPLEPFALPSDRATLVLCMTLLLSLFTAAFNLMPIPPLDGGQIALAGLQRLRGEPMSPVALRHVARVGLWCVTASSILPVVWVLASLHEATELWATLLHWAGRGLG